MSRIRTNQDIAFSVEFLDIGPCFSMLIKDGKSISLARITKKVFEVIWYTTYWREYEIYYFPDNLVETEKELTAENWKDHDLKVTIPKSSLFMYIANKHE